MTVGWSGKDFIQKTLVYCGTTFVFVTKQVIVVKLRNQQVMFHHVQANLIYVNAIVNL